MRKELFDISTHLFQFNKTTTVLVYLSEHVIHLKTKTLIQIKPLIVLVSLPGLHQCLPPTRAKQHEMIQLLAALLGHH